MRVLVFDSGIGGVAVVCALRGALPAAGLTYVMDNAWFPYGPRGDDALLRRMLAVVSAGVAAVQPDLVVLACNTASTLALAELRARLGVAFVGCVPPVKMAAAVSRSGVIGVLATPATVRGPYLRALAAQAAPACRVLVHGAAGLAALAEAKFAGSCVAQDAVAAEVAGLLIQAGASEMDAVALGCTHYGWLTDELQACLPGQVTWLDPADAVAAQAVRVAAGLGDGLPAEMDGVVLSTAATGLAGAGWRAAGLVHARRLALGA